MKTWTVVPPVAARVVSVLMAGIVTIFDDWGADRDFRLLTPSRRRGGW